MIISPIGVILLVGTHDIMASKTGNSIPALNAAYRIRSLPWLVVMVIFLTLFIGYLSDNKIIFFF